MLFFQHPRLLCDGGTGASQRSQGPAPTSLRAAAQRNAIRKYAANENFKQRTHRFRKQRRTLGRAGGTHVQLVAGVRGIARAYHVSS